MSAELLCNGGEKKKQETIIDSTATLPNLYSTLPRQSGDGKNILLQVSLIVCLSNVFY